MYTLKSISVRATAGIVTLIFVLMHSCLLTYVRVCMDSRLFLPVDLSRSSDHKYTQGEMTSQSLWSRYDRHFVGITRHNAVG